MSAAYGSNKVGDLQGLARTARQPTTYAKLVRYQVSNSKHLSVSHSNCILPLSRLGPNNGISCCHRGHIWVGLQDYPGCRLWHRCSLAVCVEGWCQTGCWSGGELLVCVTLGKGGLTLGTATDGWSHDEMVRPSWLSVVL